MTTSPSITNYFIGKGQVFFKKAGAAEFRDLGNVPDFEFTPEVEKLEHFSSRSGVKTKDRTVIIQKSGTLRIVMEEWTLLNLAIAALGGDVDTDSAGREMIEIFAATEVSGEIKLVGTNDVGAKFEWHLLKVDFIPSSSISPIGEEWGKLEVSGDCAAVNNSFGTITKLAEEGEDASSDASSA